MPVDHEAENNDEYLNETIQDDDGHDAQKEYEIEFGECFYTDIVANFLIELKASYNITNACSSFISEKLRAILHLERKKFCTKIKHSLINSGVEINPEVDAVISSENLLCRAFSKFVGEKSIDTFVSQKPMWNPFHHGR